MRGYIKLKIEFSIRRRPKELPYSNIIVPLGSIAISLIISDLLLIISGVDPTVFFVVLADSFLNFSSIRYAIPLILSGVGLAIAYKANIWNIGAEGQILAGALAASGMALFYIPIDMNPLTAYIILYIVGFSAGAGLGLLAGILRAKFNVNEVLSTLMLNYILMQIVNFLVYGPWRGSREYGYPRTDIFPENTWLPQLTINEIRTTVNIPTLIISLLAPVLMYYLLFKTRWGYEIRVIGSNPDAAEYGGISTGKVIALTMIISGGLAGIAGAGEVLGIYRQLIRAERVSAGFGYTAIIVAWLGKLNPIGALLAGYFIGVLVSAGYTLQIISRISYGAINVVTGILLLSLISLDFISKYRPIIKVIR